MEQVVLLRHEGLEIRKEWQLFRQTCCADVQSGRAVEPVALLHQRSKTWPRYTAQHATKCTSHLDDAAVILAAGIHHAVHVCPCLNLALPMAQRGQGGDDCTGRNGSAGEHSEMQLEVHGCAAGSPARPELPFHPPLSMCGNPRGEPTLMDATCAAARTSRLSSDAAPSPTLTQEGAADAAKLALVGQH